MHIDMFCIWCGGRLGSEDGHVTCLECGTEFSNMLVSETAYESSENTFLEMSVSMDCVKVKYRHPGEIHPTVTEKPAAIVCQ